MDSSRAFVVWRPVKVKRRGITLVEMLVALTITLIMMGAVISVFGAVGRNIRESRAKI